MDMNIDQRLGWQRFRVQYCKIGRYDKKLIYSFIQPWYLNILKTKENPFPDFEFVSTFILKR